MLPYLVTLDPWSVNATLLLVGEDSKASNYKDPAPVMMVGATVEDEEDKAPTLTLLLVGYITAAL